jgi:uncharacterized membrane-anchored protein
MKNPQLRLAAALLFPIVVLAANTWMYQQQRSAGESFKFPIEGFDPRDMLSGHYLFYKVDYGIPTGNGCPTSDISAALCLRPERRIYPVDERSNSCEVYLQGECDASANFTAGLERFYIPQEYAAKLESDIASKKGEIEVSIDKHGNAAILDLLIDGKTWKESIQD